MRIGAKWQEVYKPPVAASVQCHMEMPMTSQLDAGHLLALLDEALIEADRLGHTLAAALIAEFIFAVNQRRSPGAVH